MAFVATDTRKGAAVGTDCTLWRIVPACAGETHYATRVARLPEDHSQVGWLPPSCAAYHYFGKDSSQLTGKTLIEPVSAEERCSHILLDRNQP